MIAPMDPRTNLDYLSFLSEKTTSFSQKFEEFMELHNENPVLQSPAPGIFPAALQREDADASRVASLRGELNLLAGTLMDLANVTSVRIRVQGTGTIDPFVNWDTILSPKPLLETSDVRRCIQQALGRLDGLKARAEALSAPEADSSALHPLVWAAAQRLWNDGHFRQAVSASAEALTEQMKQLTNRNDASATDLWQQAFSNKAPEAGKPRLRWPGPAEDQNVKNMNNGLRQFFPGANMVIRNSVTHVNDDLSAQDAYERLATLSLLARLLDCCNVETVAESSATE